MIKIDLITGFLGSGKTTFLKKYAEYFLSQGLKIGILENDFGAVNVDMMLLQELQGENCTVETVAGACDADCHRRRFKTKLIAMGMSGYDRVLIEPSGIFDVDEFFDVLYEEPLDRWYEPGSVIAIVDSMLEKELSEQSEYLLASQTANAGILVFSKVQNANEENIAETLDHINRSLEKFRCKRRFGNNTLRKNWNDLDDDDFRKISESGYVSENYVKAFSEDNGYSSYYYMNVKMTAEELKLNTKKIFDSCDGVFRIKGFILDGDRWFEINATRENIELDPIENGQEIIIVIGENMEKNKIDSFLTSD